MVGAQLFREGLLAVVRPHIQGELLQFFGPKGTLLSSQLTDPSGLARLPYTAARPGRYTVDVRLAKNPRFRAEPVSGRIFVRRQDRPLFFVTLSSGLFKESPAPGLFKKMPENPQPLPGSVDKTTSAAACTTLVYLTNLPMTELKSLSERLADSDYPEAPVLLLESTPDPANPEGSLPDMDLLTSLIKDSCKPAYLVTGNPLFAEHAAECEVEVYLLRKTEETAHSGEAEEKEPSSEKKGLSVKEVKGWKDIPSPCKASPRGTRSK